MGTGSETVETHNQLVRPARRGRREGLTIDAERKKAIDGFL